MKTKNLKFKGIIAVLIVCIITSTINFHKVEATLNSNLPVSYIDDNFPDSYLPYINAMKAKHPNWSFKAVHTGLDWNLALSHETYEVNPAISLVQDIFGSEWKRDGKNYYYDGDYVTASKQGVAYVMDPRNFINDEGIFQFEALRYVDGVQTVEAVQNVLSPTPMGGQYKDKYKYYGQWKDLGTTYAELIHSLSKQVGINPIHIASRIRQENSGNIVSGSLIDGSHGVYNFFNIGAYDTADASAITNGLKYASNQGWTDIPTALKGGIQYIYNQYLVWGQNTIYFERFDVNNSGSAQWLLGTGYMTNIFGAKNEAKMSYSAYEQGSMLNSKFEFDIPVYENMPDEPASMPVPGDVSFTPDNTRVYLDDPRDSGVTDEFWIRTGPDTLGSILEKVYETKDGAENRTKYTRIGIGNNTLYDKIRYDDGRIGYILKQWVYEYKYTKVESVSLNTTYTNLNVGDTLKLQATVLPQNAQDKSVKWTTSDANIASVDNSGTVTATGSGVATITVTTNDQSKTAICTVNVKAGKVESIELASDEYIVHLGKSINIIPTILPANASNKNYSIEIEDGRIAKVEGKGIIGLAEGQTYATFITEEGNFKAKAKIIVKKENKDYYINLDSSLRLENNYVSNIDLNNNTVDKIRNKIDTNYDVKFIDIENKEISGDSKVGTGTKIQFLINNSVEEEYTIIIYGDVDGTGVINARDLLMLQRYILGKMSINPIQVKAAITDKTSSEPKAVDLLRIQRHILGKYVIEQ